MRNFALPLTSFLIFAGGVFAQDTETAVEPLEAVSEEVADSGEVAPTEDTPTDIQETAEAAAPEPDPAEEMRKEMERLRNESSLRELEIKAELAEQIEATQRLKIESAHRRAKLQETLTTIKEERETLAAEAALREAKLAEEFAEIQAQNKRLELELALFEGKKRKELSEIGLERDRLAADFSVREQRLRAELSEMELERMRTQAELASATDKLKLREVELQSEKVELLHEAQKLDLERKRLLASNEKAAVELVQLKQKLDLRAKEKAWESAVNEPIDYPLEPFDGETLSVSDRRIPLNGPIITGTANFITERIHFFNNQSPEAPIFIVIDSCPGGSVMEGYRILKAMKASRAPVHVVVKSFAASMAAVILTMADDSYAFPNAVILHHQPSGWNGGNLTQQSEQVEILQEWASRLHKPVADKMEVSLEEFYSLMYENASTGDWQEFADEAQKLKWVDHITLEVREEGITEKPRGRAPRPFFFFLGSDGEIESGSDTESRIPQAAMLPTPAPYDFYFLYNRSGFYQWPSL